MTQQPEFGQPDLRSPEEARAYFERVFRYASLELGISTFDTSVAGLGGCPYAKGATGNVATEDVVYMLHGLSIQTGIDLDRLRAAGRYISDHLGRPSGSRVARALAAKDPVAA